MLVIKRIHVRYRLRAAAHVGATVERVHAMHHRFCPVYRTLAGCIAITTEIEVTDPPESDG